MLLVRERRDVYACFVLDGASARKSHQMDRDD